MNGNKRQLSPIISSKENGLKRQRLVETCGTDGNDKEDICLSQRECDSEASGGVASNRRAVRSDFGCWTRCLVGSVERDRKKFDLVLQLNPFDDLQKKEYANNDCDGNIPAEMTTTCRLQGPWCHTRIKVGDIVSVLAVWDDKLQTYKVDKDEGFCVTNPDTLISGTTVLSSLFCSRRSVLEDRFKGVDPNSKIMVIGSLVHELFQNVLVKGLKSYKEIQGAAKELLESRETAYTLYASLMTRKEAEQEFETFVPKILTFVQQYVVGQVPAPPDQFAGTISEIKDIEENLWLPQLGLKGKVDVSARVNRSRGRANQKNVHCAVEDVLLPLELKTGRATFSLEHKGQVTLYQMMLNAAGKEVHSGLLLYLREGIMREIQSSRNEQRDLIMLRNDLSYYFSHSRDATDDTLSKSQSTLKHCDGKLQQPFELPEPISHHSACGKCAYATVCCSFAQTDTALQLAPGHPLVRVIAESTAHLQAADYEYFIHWCDLLTLEDKEIRKSNNLRSLWVDPPDVRVRQGRAIDNLELLNSVEYKEARYLHTFKIKTPLKMGLENEKGEDIVLDLRLCGFSVGEYVIVSSTKRLAVASGCIYDLSKSTISLSLERNLLKNYAGKFFIVDKHESQSGNVFNYTNLSLLLDNNERAAKLRAIIVQREQPTFADERPQSLLSKGAGILKELNSVQRAAALKALAAESFMLIKGLPGTGKTQTLVAIVRLLHLLGKSVLITSHTHSAVDNLMIRLKPYGLPMLRLGSTARINPQLQEFGECMRTQDCRTEEDFARVYASCNVVGVTCLGSAHSIFLHRRFDFCIVDEATQVMQCTVFRPLFFCDRFILVGDPDQLPPLIRSKEARQRGADESLFQRLDTSTATKVLTLQYRMNKTITKLANHLAYSGKLLCANKNVETGVMSVKEPSAVLASAAACSAEKWLQRALNPHIDQGVFFLDTGDCSELSYSFASKEHKSTYAALELKFAEEPTIVDPPCTKSHNGCKHISKYTNYCEAAIIFHIVRYLLIAGFAADRIGIIAPYRAQVELLLKLSEQHAASSQGLPFAQVEVNTVDQYQGRDKDIVIYSCTKTGGESAGNAERPRNAEILEDKRRLTVAITRSKHKLIIIGDVNCLKQYTPFYALLSGIPSYSKMKLEEGKLNFSWELLLARLSEVIGF